MMSRCSRSSLLRRLVYPFTALALLSACAVSTSDSAPVPTDVEVEHTDPVSSTALAVEQAERLLDRGQDAQGAKQMLIDTLDDPQLSPDDRLSATLALSRAHEALGDTESAIVVLEQEMAQHASDPSWSNPELHRRLRQLITGSPERIGLEPRETITAVPFARLLSTYFSPKSDGGVEVNLFMFGGNSDASAQLGTFDVSAGLRAEREDACPLCTDQLNVHTHRSGSDWLMIPLTESTFDDALLVFYFDLSRNRIPARYERYLPMPVADIERDLEAGKSFIVAKERQGAPPAILIAAPRTALLADVEKHLAELDHLPLTPEVVDVSTNLRPNEIQGVVRGDYFGAARQCYETELLTDKQAKGKVTLRFGIEATGAVLDPQLEAVDGLDSAAFRTCILDALAKLQFPAANGTRTVTYPIVFGAD